MKQYRHLGKAIAVLPIAAVLLVAPLMVGQTQGRNENLSQWSAVYAPEQTYVSSDYLRAEGQTVLCADWTMESTASRMEGFHLKTNTGTAAGSILCTSDGPEYLTAAADYTALQVDTTGAYVQLTLSPTQAALALQEQMTVTVRVSWTRDGELDPELWADYQVTLLPAAQEPSEETAEEETSTEETVPQETTGETTPEETAAEEASAVSETEDTQPADAGEETAPTEEASGNTDQTTQPENEPVEIGVVAASSFAWTERLPLTVTTPETADTLVLDMGGSVFPELTRYYLDGQAYMLADAMKITVPVSGAETKQLLLDLAALTMPETGTVTFGIQTLSQGEVTGQNQISASASREALSVDTSGVDPVLTGDGVLSIPVCQDTNGLSWRLELLTRTETGIEYAESEDQFYIVVKKETDASDSSQYITISNVDSKAPAGSYRLVLERRQGDLVLGSQQVLFFICY